MGETHKVTLARQIAGVFGLRIAHAALLFASSIAAARLLGPEGKGIVGLLGVFMGTVVIFSSLGLPGAVIFRMGRQAGEFRKIFAGALPLFFALGIAGLIIAHVLWLAGFSSSVMNGVELRMFAAASLLIPASLIDALLSAAARASGSIRLAALSPIIKETVYICALASGVILLGLGVWGAVLGMLISEAALLLWCLWLLRDKLAPEDYVPAYSPELNSGLLSFGLKSYAASLMQQLNYRLDLFLVNYFASVGAVGVYSVATGLSESLLILPSAVCFALFPKASSMPRQEAAAITVSLARRAFWLIAVCGALLCLTAGLLVPLLYGDTFAGAVRAVYLLVPGIAALSFSWIIGAYFEGTGRPQYVAVAVAVGLLFTVALDLLLIPRFGIYGAAAASSISYGAVTVRMLYIFCRESGVRAVDFLRFRAEDFKLSEILRSLGLGVGNA